MFQLPADALLAGMSTVLASKQHAFFSFMHQLLAELQMVLPQPQLHTTQLV